MSSSITQANVDALEQALVSGELQVRMGDRWITYRSVEEIREALAYARDKVAASGGSVARPRGVVVSVDRGLS